MRNSYEMPEGFELGRAIEEILGTKPPGNEIDGILGFGWSSIILPDDVDESDD
jgi:hypothetical protein